jgi:hypothetical protein
MPPLGNGRLPLIYQACQVMLFSPDAANVGVKQQIKHRNFLFEKDFLR